LRGRGPHPLEKKKKVFNRISQWTGGGGIPGGFRAEKKKTGLTGSPVSGASTQGGGGAGAQIFPGNPATCPLFLLAQAWAQGDKTKKQRTRRNLHGDLLDYCLFKNGRAFAGKKPCMQGGGPRGAGGGPCLFPYPRTGGGVFRERFQGAFSVRGQRGGAALGRRLSLFFFQLGRPTGKMSQGRL